MTTITNSATLNPGERIPGPPPAPAKYGWPKTPHDDLPLPGGKRLGQVDNLARVLTELKIPGASHSEGREFNARMYAEHLERIAKAAGDKAMADWVASNG